MSLTIGQLTIEMAANVARIRTDMDASRRIVDNAANTMAGAMRRVENIISLGLGGAAVGAAATFGRSLYEASAQAERLALSLNFATGGNGARELAYVSEVANRLGLDFNTTAQAYANFAAASRGTNIEGTQTQAVFEAVAKASAVMGLTTDNTRGVLLALQQMMNKGTVSAEELRGQLGERLPGAFQIAARAMGVTTQELGKMLEQGQVISDTFLPAFARQMESELGGAAESAAYRLDAETNRMSNAWEKLKKSIGDAGVAESSAHLANGLTNDMNTISDAMDMARATGGDFFDQMKFGLGATVARTLGLQYFSDAFLPLADRIKAADQRLAELQEKTRQGYGVSIYFKADLASAKAEIEALQALQIAMGQKVAGAGRGDGQIELEARRNQYTTADPFAGAKALDDVRKGAKLRQDIQMAEGAKAVEIAKAFGKAIAAAGEDPAYATQLAAERDARLIALRRETHAQL
jgi:tape measure domain-containing protein